jgi:hypothetical protein
MCWEVFFPYGWLDLAMWATVPLWAWTLWTPNKKDWYWLLSMIVCVIWLGFDWYIKIYSGAILNLIAFLVLLSGYKRYKNGKKSVNG